MSSVLNFLQSEHVIALLTTLLLFFITIFLTVKHWIGFSMTSLLLLFALIAGMLINFQPNIQNYFTSSPSITTTPISNETPSEDFHKQMMQAMDNLKVELSAEKEYLVRVMNQVQEIFDSMDAQKQTLQTFIEEVRGKFKIDYPTSSSPTPSESSSISNSPEQTPKA